MTFVKNRSEKCHTEKDYNQAIVVLWSGNKLCVPLLFKDKTRQMKKEWTLISILRIFLLLMI